jgi:hypothetical protein
MFFGRLQLNFRFLPSFPSACGHPRRELVLFLATRHSHQPTALLPFPPHPSCHCHAITCFTTAPQPYIPTLPEAIAECSIVLAIGHLLKPTAQLPLHALHLSHTQGAGFLPSDSAFASNRHLNYHFLPSCHATLSLALPQHHSYIWVLFPRQYPTQGVDSPSGSAFASNRQLNFHFLPSLP